MLPLPLIPAGMLLCNSIPHLAAGLQGVPFPTPFAKPRGVGDSSPVLNFLWGALNLAGAVALAWWRRPSAEPVHAAIAFGAGFVAMGLYLSLHFGRVRAARVSPKVGNRP